MSAARSIRSSLRVWRDYNSECYDTTQIYNSILSSAPDSLSVRINLSTRASSWKRQSGNETIRKKRNGSYVNNMKKQKKKTKNKNEGEWTRGEEKDRK